MASDGKLYIIVTNQLPGGTTVVPGVEPEKKENKEQESALAKFAQHRFFSLIQSQAQQALTYSINNIGNFAGDYTKQIHTSESVQILTFISDLAVSAYAGFKMTGSPIGAAVAVGTQLIGKGITTAEQVYAGYVENVRQNRAIAQLRTRAGLNSANNGSRGTDQ